jgi:hypothetical protein
MNYSNFLFERFCLFVIAQKFSNFSLKKCVQLDLRMTNRVAAAQHMYVEYLSLYFEFYS